MALEVAAVPLEGYKVAHFIQMLIQGGVGETAKKELIEKIGDQDFASGVILLCPNKHGVYDARIFGGVCSDDPSLLNAQVKCTYTLNLGDPTMREPWNVTQLDLFYQAIEALKVHLDKGETVVVTCVAGQNRSRAIAHALDSEMPLPECTALVEAAKAMNDPNRLRLAPLYPKRARRARE